MSLENVSAFISTIGALVSIYFAYRSHSNEKSIRAELKAAEKLLFGKPHNPSFIKLRGHRDCVLEIPIYNASTSKKAFITKLQAFNHKGEIVDVVWSGRIDELGNISNQGELLGLEDFSNLYLRALDGECINYLSIKIFHTFSGTAQNIIFDKYANL
jgi:hypothetical protein